MEKPAYVVKSTPDALQHIFESINDEKIIKKIVAFVQVEENPDLFQLVFGDLTSDGQIDVFSVSNNNDMKLVLTTVIGTLLTFFDKNPSKTVIFTGSTTARTRLYRAVISKHLKQSELFYDIKGILENGKSEHFESNHIYLGYLIKQKNEK